MGTEGTRLLAELNEGSREVLPTAYVAEHREKITEAIEELLDVGARIRPLFVGKSRAGWARGVHLAERRALKRWLWDDSDRLEHLLLLGTSLSRDEIRDLSLAELRQVSRLVSEMTEADLSLYPYISAFVTTSVSEQLWCARRAEIASFRDREVRMPDGARIEIRSPPDQARLWAALCEYRTDAKRRVEATSNAVMLLRAWAGKSADPLAADLKAAARALVPDIHQAWTEVIAAERKRDFDDGWAHSEDDSPEGIQRELKGMLSHDRHERVMAAFEKQQMERAEKRKREALDRIAERGGPGFVESATVILTGEQMAARAASLARGRPAPESEASDYEVGPDLERRARKYM